MRIDAKLHKQRVPVPDRLRQQLAVLDSVTNHAVLLKRLGVSQETFEEASSVGGLLQPQVLERVTARVGELLGGA